MVMMRPKRRRIMPRMTARDRRKAPVRLISSTFSQSSSFRRSASMSRVMPALLTRMSTLPIAASDSFTRRSRSAASSILAVMTWARSPISAFSASSASARVPESTTAAPWRCSPLAMAPPMPPEAPVTSAALPVRSNMELSRSGGLEEGFGVGRRVHRHAGHLAVDTLDQASEHLASADLDQGLDALALHRQHAFAPAHAGRDLLDQQLLD